MAKKDKKKKDKQGSGATDPVEAVRSAVERTFKATSEGAGGAQKHARDLVDEVAHAANRFREAMGDLKVLDDLKTELASLRARVAALEGRGAKPASSTAAKASASKPAASRAESPASKPAASRAKSSASKPSSSRVKSSASKPAASRARAKSSASKPAASRAKSSGTRSKPASSSS